MATLPRSERLTLPLAPAAALCGAALVALIFLFMPSGLLERLVNASGAPSWVAAAEPPLGLTARIALAGIFGLIAAAFTWCALMLLNGRRTVDLIQASEIMRRRDIHPDAPPRPPLFANRDLGTPFLDVRAPEPEPEVEPEPDPILAELHQAFEGFDQVPVERSLPANLDRPMAEFDPGALRPTPLAPPPPLAPLARPQLIDPGDRFETFELTPFERAAPLSLNIPPVDPLPEPPAPQAKPAISPEPVVAPETEATVHSLLARLERGLADRQAAAEPAPKHSLQDTLGELRQLATGAP